MKTIGTISTVIFWLLIYSGLPASAQIKLKTSPQQEQNQIISQIGKFPSDLFDPILKNAAHFRNNLKSSEEPDKIKVDSVILYMSSSPSQRETYIYDPDGNLISYVKETFNGIGWKYSEMNTYEYDDNNRLLMEIMQSWIGFYWEKTHQLTYTYDFSGNMLTYRIQNWESGKWNDYSLFTYTYDNYGNILSFLEQSWNSTAWINMNQVSNNYDDNGNLVHSLKEIWFEEAWVNSTQNSNSFNERGKMLTSNSQAWFDSDWINTECHFYSYDGEENLLSHLHQLYSQGWVNYMLYTYTYDENGNNLEYSEQQWDNTMWRNQIRITRSFDQSGNKLSELNQEWLNTWNNVSNTLYTYDDAGNYLTYTTFFWNNVQWENYMKVEYTYDAGFIRGTGYNWNGTDWINADAWMDVQEKIDGEMHYFLGWWGSEAEVYYSVLFTGIDAHNMTKEVPMEIFPNPARESLNISIQENVSGQIRLFNLNGSLIGEYAVKGIDQTGGNLKVPVNNLSSGIYSVQLTTGNETFEQKVNIIR